MREQARPGTIKASMKLPAFARVLALSGFAAAAAIAQQSTPAAPPKTAAPPPPALTSVGPAATSTDLGPDSVVLTIGNQSMTRAQFEVLLSALSQNGRPVSPADRRKVAEQYAELETMAQEARKRKLDESAEVKQMMSIQSDSYLANALAKRISDETHFTELDLRSYYDSNKGEFEEAKGGHILIRFKGSTVPLKAGEKDLTDAEALAKAQDIRKQLMAGADFATLAKAESDDAGSGAKGGDLGTFKHGQMVGPFDQAAFSVAVGEVSEPVKTQFGYHLIKITSRTAKSFDEAKPQIEKDLKPKMAKVSLEQIKDHTSVTLNESYFGPAGPSAPAGPAGPGK
jgi:peptidyl-prolyl cis-trans isomerase C